MTSILLALLVSAAGAETPAAQRIVWAQQKVDRSPSAAAWTDLAMAFARRARETSDPSFYAQAEAAVEHALSLSPEDFGALKARTWALLGRHEFAKARDLARDLNRRNPDDVIVYGFLADAQAELGDYADAEEAAQWMLNLRAGNVASLTRGAYIRELIGDVPGAIEFMEEALQGIAASEIEDRAWTLTQIAHLHLSLGRLEPAEQALEEALRLFPGYHYALAQQAKLRAAQGRTADAVELLRRRYESAPHAENLFDLAAALERAGHSEEARQAFAEFEKKARLESDSADNANRELIHCLADHGRAAEAVRPAERETARRHDVFTLDAQAWALHRAGRSREARRPIEQALAVGIRDARLDYHAGVIAAAAGDGQAAARYLSRSLETNAASEVAADARSALQLVERSKANASRQSESRSPARSRRSASSNASTGQ